MRELSEARLRRLPEFDRFENQKAEVLHSCPDQASSKEAARFRELAQLQANAQAGVESHVLFTWCTVLMAGICTSSRLVLAALTGWPAVEVCLQTCSMHPD